MDFQDFMDCGPWASQVGSVVASATGGSKKRIKGEDSFPYPVGSTRFSTHRYIAGRMSRVRIVEERVPPTTTVARGF